VTITVRLPPADAPGISSPASSTTGLYTVSWNSVATAESYQLEEQVNGGGWVAQYDGTMLTRYMSQRPSATYQYRVRACNASGCGPYSGVTQTVVAINRIPLDFKVRYSASGYPQQTTRYYFFWNPVVGATRYEINTIKQQTITVQSTVQNPYETAMGGPPIHFGDSYRIRSCDAGSCSDWSEWVKHASY
jgi:predicted phage tail protein